VKELSKKTKKQIKKDIAALIKHTSLATQGMDFVEVTSDDKKFTLIGCGCTSAVFRSKKFPYMAVKIYSKEHRKEVFLETLAYKKVRGIKYFPKLYLYGKNYLVMEFIEGQNLYDCLIEGIDIPDKVINQVDTAIDLAKARGLKPSDVHAKNIIVNENTVRLIDLSDYLTAQHVTRWDRLKFLYKTVYKPFVKGHKIPKKLIDVIRRGLKYLEIFVKFLKK
jgi:predicted Ser/Thr protein kinase